MLSTEASQVSNLVELYPTIQRMVASAGAAHYIQKADCEDIIQDVCVDILEQDIPPSGYRDAVYKRVGQYRRDRSRERARRVSWPDGD